MTRKETISRLRDQVAQGIPIIGAGAGTGISAKCEELGGADLIMRGVPASAGILRQGAGEP
jgi:predicted TIM-barrel enzyme